MPSTQHLQVQKQALAQKAKSKLPDNVTSQLVTSSQKLDVLGNKVQPGQLPEYLQSFKTTESLPSYFRTQDTLPPKGALIPDVTPAEKIYNLGYERQKKIEQKRATENAIQSVANSS